VSTGGAIIPVELSATALGKFLGQCGAYHAKTLKKAIETIAVELAKN